MTTEVPIGTIVTARIKVDACQYSEWLQCVRVDRNTLRVVSPDPPWYGCTWNMRKDAGVEVKK